MADRPPAPIYRSQGNSLFRTDAGNSIVSRGQDVPYDVNGAPTGAAVADGDYGDIVVSAGAWSIDANVVTFAKMAVATAASIVGATAAGNHADLTPVQAKSVLAITAADVSGLGYFATGTDAANLSGTVAAARLPAFSGGDVTSVAGSAVLTIGANKVTFSKFVAATGAGFVGALAAGNFGQITGTQATSLLDTFTSALRGLVPASGGGTANFLRADGSWAAPPGGTSFRGAMVTKVATESAANYSTAAAVPWDSEVYDTDSIHDTVTTNTRLTVPAGVTKVKVGGTARLISVTGNTAVLAYISKNGGALYPGIPLQAFQVGTIAPNLNLSSGSLPVTPGDYFEFVLSAVDTSIDIHSTSNFWLEVVA